MKVFCSLSGSRCRRPGEVCGEEGVVVGGGGELSARPGHVVARHDEDDITVPPPQHLHGVSEEAALVPAEDVPDVALLPPHPQLVAPPGVHPHHHPDQSELSWSPGSSNHSSPRPRPRRDLPDDAARHLQDPVLEHQLLPRLSQHLCTHFNKRLSFKSICQQLVKIRAVNKISRKFSQYQIRPQHHANILT